MAKSVVYAVSMRVRVLYLGMLKEIAERDRDEVQLAENARLDELFSELQRRIPRLNDFRSAIAMAVNYEYADGRTVLRDKDEVALLPPVSGGSPSGAKTKDEPSTAETPLPLISEHARMVRGPINALAVQAALKRPEDGALAIFDGVVRNHSHGRRTLHLEYTAYERMALQQMELLAQQALARFPIRDLRIVHRLGRLQIGETSVYIAVASAHRAAAFDACRWLIDTLKTTVPIWKKEYFEDGAVWADGEPFRPEVPRAGETASK
ncbi:MAG TPA: molybdenum cofactor biosynthesis protein MoaE [Terriglobales bacterium]|nr:molybdenum cofactor biosynthesis protein MoaE [Terriglobales bacterium]